ncbi:hypothetical protein FOZ76_14810 [Verticiella sediminum]|uniref:MaoC-like domain-containing protein n=1 Tax=Verticiella sediminum TaxID=1247510 RepID=A0A556AIF6_9BURK|nr:MaoC/PaaZ C-terminal domain-containing protein [Verticiella sediminum]TSH92684.1 hypothetical protein FOZ76_14810 [Verticiella sediminum]
MRTLDDGVPGGGVLTVHPLNRARLQSCRLGDVLAGVDLPAVTMTQLAFYCAAVGVTDPIHYDRDFARKANFADAVVNGSLRVAWMAQVLAELAPEPGLLLRLHCSHRGIMLVGEAPHYSVRYAGHESTLDGGCLLHCRIEASVNGQIRDVGDASLRLAAD